MKKRSGPAPGPRRTKTAAIVDLAMKGASRTEISAQVGATMGTISAILSKARRDGQPIPKAKSGRKTVIHCGRKTVNFQSSTIDALIPEAAARGIEVADLIRDLVATIAEDRIVGAILDDGITP